MRTNLISDREEGYVNNPFYKHILADNNLQAVEDYLDLMNNFYFKLITDAANTKDTYDRAELRCLVQMMFTKGLQFRKMLDGVSFRCENVHLNTITDHTVLQTMVRNMYEFLLGFELVNMIPDTEDKKTILFNVYKVSSLQSRLKMFTKDAMLRYKERFKEEQEYIDICKKRISDTALYQNMSPADKKMIKDEIKRGTYQIMIEDDGHVKHVSWDGVREYCSLNTDVLHGLYKYLCNMAHPSYFALVQFRESYKEPNAEFTELACSATRTALLIMSVFIMDFMLVFPDTQCTFDKMDAETRFMISMYNDAFRKSSFRKQKT